MSAGTSWVEKLGFAEGDRVVVVHVDDIGMCDAANQGALCALDGLATCGSVMVPCPAFDSIAEIARQRPELDLGVHLTLNAEHASHRWGPLRDDVPSLTRADGTLWPTYVEAVEHGDPSEVERELRVQVERALEAGIDVTHLDSHMGTVLDRKFVHVYARLARDFRLPAFVPRIDVAALSERGMGEDMALYVRLIDDFEASGFPIFNHFDDSSLGYEPGTGLRHNTERVDGLGTGLSYLITHAAQGGAELEAITADWRQRDEERRIYSDGSMARVFEERGIRTIGMRRLRDLLHAASS